MAVEPTLTVDKLGTRVWRVNGLRHRTDGPAVEWADGDRWWFLNDRRYTFREWLNKLDEHTRLLMILKYGS